MAFRDTTSSIATPAQRLVEALTEILRHEAVHEWVNTAGKNMAFIVALRKCVVSCVFHYLWA